MSSPTPSTWGSGRLPVVPPPGRRWTGRSSSRARGASLPLSSSQACSRRSPRSVRDPLPGSRSVCSSAPQLPSSSRVWLSGRRVPRSWRPVYVSSGLALAVTVGGRHVERRVLVEEAKRLELEAGVLHRHDGPILEPYHVVCAERVPDDHVLILERTVLLDVLREAVARVLVGVGPCRVVFVLREPGRPEVFGREPGPACDRAVGLEEGQDVGAQRDEAVSAGLPDLVRRPCALYAPVAG